MSDETPLKAATLAANFPGAEAADGAVVPPWQPSTTYENRAESGYSYLRDNGPMFNAAEKRLAALEHGADALLFASGMAAADVMFRSLPAGSHVVIPEIMYWALRGWLQNEGPRMGLSVSSVANDSTTLQCA